MKWTVFISFSNNNKKNIVDGWYVWFCLMLKILALYVVDYYIIMCYIHTRIRVYYL